MLEATIPAISNTDHGTIPIITEKIRRKRYSWNGEYASRTRIDKYCSPTSGNERVYVVKAARIKEEPETLAAL